MLTKHVNRFMIHHKDFPKYLRYFANCQYYCFDTETCCTSKEVYDIYYNKKVKCTLKGRHAKVYAWALSNTDNDYVIYGETLEQFISVLKSLFEYLLDTPGKSTLKRLKELQKLSKINIAVHNLKFDIEFLKYVLFDQGFEYSNSIVVDGKPVGKTKSDKSFNVIENDGIVYGANILLEPFTYKTRKGCVNIVPQIEFFDTFKIMSQPLENIAKNVIKIDEMFYKLSEKYDYNSVRENGHNLTQLEKNYLYNDVYILKEFLVQFYMPIGTNCKTASSIAFKEFLKYTWNGDTNKVFDMVFPSIYDNPKIAHNVKKSYKGGWTFADRHYLGKHLKYINGTSIDINSSYPSQMYFKPLPYGKPKLYEGFKALASNQLAIYTIEFDTFYNKDSNDYFGFLQASETNLTEYGYNGTDYVHTNIIDGEEVGYSIDATERRFRKYIWNFELDNILEHTCLTNLIVLETLVFKSKVGIFNKAIDHFMQMKIEGKETGNNALTQYAKLCLNSFYGKMASNIERFERTIVMKNGLAVFENTDIYYETDKKYYPPFASAVTSWGRCTLRDALYKLCVKDGKFSPNVLYCDTDSIYSLLPIDEVRSSMSESLHPTELGKWDIEKQYNEFKAIGSKKYMLTTNKGDIVCKCAGLPKEARNIVTFNTFYLGASFEGKLANKKVPGGVLLIPIDFKLKVTSFNM